MSEDILMKMHSRQTVDSEIDVSVVVYVDRHLTHVLELYHSAAHVLKEHGKNFEFLFIDDGNSPSVSEQLVDLQGFVKYVRVFQLPRTYGVSTAMSIGFKQARGKLILTLGSFLQVEPRQIGKMFRMLEEGNDFVNGWRVKRKDSLVNIAESWIYNWMIRRVSKVHLHDSNCTLKLFKKEVAEELAIYGDYYRFIPILAARRGFRVAEARMVQLKETNRHGFYSIGTYVLRVLDLLALLFIGRFTEKPLRFFGLIGSALFVMGVSVNLHLVYLKLVGGEGIGNRPLLLLGTLLMVLGLQTASVGLIGELIIFTKPGRTKEYRIERIIEG